MSTTAQIVGAKGRRPTRFPLLALLVAFVVAAIVVERGSADAPVDVAAATDAGVPVVGGPAVETSTWFCAGGTAEEGGRADHVVVVANVGSESRRGTLTVHTDTGAGAERSLDVPVGARVRVRLGDLVAAPYAAALVELDGGEVVVEHEVSGPAGFASSSCTDRTSSSWYFAWGVTARDGNFLLAIHNPFPEIAVLDLTFSTDEGQRRPNAFLGLVVDASSVTVVDVGSEVTLRDVVSTSVVARTGRVVVDRLQVLDGSQGPSGLDLELGSPVGHSTWLMAAGEVAAEAQELIVVYNPGEEQAGVDVIVRASEGDPIEPFELTVPPGRFAFLDLSAEERVPSGLRHSTVVESVNDQPIVVERVSLSPARRTVAAVPDPAGSTTTTTEGAAPDASPGVAVPADPGFVPLFGSGVSATMASPVLSTSLVVASLTEQSVLFVQNPSGDRGATAQIELTSPTGTEAIDGLGAVELDPAATAVIDLAGRVSGTRTALVTADAGVVVERLERRPDITELSVTAAVSRADAAVLATPVF